MPRFTVKSLLLLMLSVAVICSFAANLLPAVFLLIGLAFVLGAISLPAMLIGVLFTARFQLSPPGQTRSEVEQSDRPTAPRLH